MGMFNCVFFVVVVLLEFQSSRFVSGGPGNSKTRKTNKNNKIKFLLFIPRLSLGMKNPKTPKTDATPSLPLKSPNNNPRPNFGLPILILVFGVPPHGTARCSWPIVPINAGPGG